MTRLPTVTGRSRSGAARAPSRSRPAGPRRIRAASDPRESGLLPAARGLALALVLVCAGTLPLSASAQPAYPAKPVRLVVGFAAGGIADITARAVAQRLGERMGQPFVVDNRPGAGGIVAADLVAKAEPDGHTLLLLTNGNAVSVSLFRSLPFDTVRDFAPVALLGTFDLVVVASADSKLRSIADVIAAAKAAGGRFNVATINPGSTQHLSAEFFRLSAAIAMTTVPYKATPAVLAAVRGGEVDAAFEVLGPMLPQIRGGALRALAVTGAHRFPGLPDVPTMQESGIANYNVSSWNALAAPAATSAAVVQRLNGEVNAVLAIPELRRQLQDLGVVAQGGSPEVLRALLASEIPRWRDVIERARIERQ